MGPTDDGTDESTVTPSEKPTGDELLQHILRGLLRPRQNESRRGAWRQRRKPSERIASRQLKHQSHPEAESPEGDSKPVTHNPTGTEIVEALKRLGTQSRERSGRATRRNTRG